jgi:hypothetical protein
VNDLDPLYPDLGDKSVVGELGGGCVEFSEPHSLNVAAAGIYQRIDTKTKFTAKVQFTLNLPTSRSCCAEDAPT